MAKEVVMPALGMAQATGILLQWLKGEGEKVTKGEPLMEVETDKATVEIEAPASGILAGVTAQPGEEIPVGQVIALILAAGESAPEPTAKPALSQVPAVSMQAASAPDGKNDLLASPVAERIAAEYNLDLRRVTPAGKRIQKEDVLAYLSAQQAAPRPGQLLASPKARRLAREHELNLAMIAGSGPDGAVLAADVLAAAKTPPQAAPPVSIPEAALLQPETLPMSRIWQVMVQRLVESWQNVPHFYLTAEANASRVVAWREQVQQRFSQKVTYTDLLVKLVALALRRHPRLNARWNDGTIIANPDINIGLAVAVEEGLLAPVIHQADRLGVAELATRRQNLVSRAQANKLSLDELSQGSFTISNLGMYGVDAFNAIINPPQAAILALGRITERVVPVNGLPAVQPMLTMTLSCDHRVVDGARGGQFLQTLVSFIEDPLQVLD